MINISGSYKLTAQVNIYQIGITQSDIHYCIIDLFTKKKHKPDIVVSTNTKCEAILVGQMNQPLGCMKEFFHQKHNLGDVNYCNSVDFF